MKRTLAPSLVIAALASATIAQATFDLTFANASGRAAEPEHISFDSLANTAVSSMEFASGKLAQAHRTWAPFVITHTLLKGQPSLYAQGSNMPNITINSQELVKGTLKPFYTIQLTGVTVSRDPGSTPTVEKLDISFSKITWTWTDGGITYTDNWTK